MLFASDKPDISRHTERCSRGMMILRLTTLRLGSDWLSRTVEVKHDIPYRALPSEIERF